MKKILILAVCLLAAVSVWASTPTPGGKPWDSEEGGSTAVTRTVEYRILELHPNRTLLLADRDNRQQILRLPEDVEIKPQSKREYDGLKQLDFGHLQVGDRLKITFMSEDGRLVRIKAKRAS